MELLELGTLPVSDESPAGKDVRYEPDFEALSSEISKMSTIAGGSEIDWDNVVSLSSVILEKESKHLQVGCYLCYGLAKTSSIEGFAQGIHILKELLINFWEPMFPPKKRMKGRRGIIVWWEEKISDFLNDVETVTWEKEKRDDLVGDLNTMDEFLGENMEDAPLLIPMIKRIKSAVNEQKDASQEEENVGGDSSVDAPQTINNAKISIDSDMTSDAMLEHGFDIIGKSASGLIAENPFNPIPYRLNRIVAWIPIDELPTAEGGKTMIPPPDEQIISAMATLYDNSNWEDLADSCESNVRQFLFWLDLSRYVAECMEQLGHEDVCKAIEMETLLFVQRLKGIEQLCFSDGTPFADGVTKEWLSKLVHKGSGNGPQAGTGDAGSVRQLIAQNMDEAQQLIKQKQPDKAIALLMECSSKSTSERERFLWKMSVCRILINLKKHQIASSYIDEMLDYIEKFKLEIWEPDNAIEALSLALTGLRLQKNDQHESLIESIIKKISMLDPITAMRII
jgi:type VI secretion system protein VasJ